MLKLQYMQVSLFRSALSNWFGLALAAVIGFVISPFVVHSLGPEQYGLWVLALSITSQLIVLDFGIGYALTREVARCKSSKNFGRLSEILPSALVLLIGTSAIGLCLLIPIYFFGPSILNITEINQDLFRATLIILGIDIITEILSARYHGVLSGLERYDIVNGLNIGRLILNALLLVLVLNHGGGIIGVACTVVIVRLLHRVAIIICSLRILPEVKSSVQKVGRKALIDLISFGFWSTIIVLGARFIFQLDTIVVGGFLGTAAVTLYAIPLILIEQFRAFTQGGAAILFPRLSALSGPLESDLCKTLLLKWAFYGELVAIAIGVPFILTGGDFIALWMGTEFRASSTVLTILTIPYFFCVPALGFVNLAYAVGQHSLYAKLYIVEGILNLAVSICLVTSIGMIGVALGTLIPSILISGVIIPACIAKRCGLSFATYLFTAFITPLPLAIGHAAILRSLQLLIPSDTWSGFVIDNALALLASAILTFTFFIPREDKDYFRRRLGID